MFIYKIIVRPLLFWLNVEQARTVALLLLRLIRRLPFGLPVLRKLYSFGAESLERDVFVLKFRNHVGLAAGFDIDGEAIRGLDALGFGFVEIGAITPEPQSGNPRPRLFRLAKDRAIIQRMGHPNKGWEYAINNLRSKRGEIIVGCNIARNNNTKHSQASREYLKVFRNLYQYADYFTININFSHLLNDTEYSFVQALESLLTPLFDFRRGQSVYRPILVKVTADLENEVIDSVTDVLLTTPLDGIVAVHGTMRRDGLQSSDSSIDSVGAGRLSGAPLFKRAVEVVERIHERSGGGYPIIGVGGVSSAEDVQRLLGAGASLVQIYSSFIYDGPTTPGVLCRDLAAMCPPTEGEAKNK